MNRLRLLAATTGLTLAFAVAAPASAAPVTCYGTTVITGQQNLSIRVADGTTFVSFDFTGTHTLCLADGTRVEAPVSGHLEQSTSSSGVMNLRFTETLWYGDGTMQFAGRATLSGDVWRSSVRTVGRGTGELEGIVGQGTFWPISPTSFGDAINYVYRG